ncbi:MAG TPA: EamA family transporter [Micavibrio sp.]
MLVSSWAFLTVCGAVFWGLAYALLGKLLHSGIASSFALTSIGICTLSTYIFVMMKTGVLPASLAVVNDNKFILVLLVAVAACLISGQFLIYKAIALKDAPHVAILEISYPIFTCLFTWAFFRNLELSWHIIVGGALILAGSALVLFKSNQG